MNRLIRGGLILATIAVGLGAGIGIHYITETPKQKPAPRNATAVSVETESRLPAFQLVTPDGDIADSANWNNKILIVNFWATWCTPCKKEMPAFVRFQEKYRDHGVQFVGIAMDEPQPVREFIAQLGVNYPILLDDGSAVTLSRRMGNRKGVLPYTAIYNRAGELIHTRAGEISELELSEWIEPLLKESEAQAIR